MTQKAKRLQVQHAAGLSRGAPVIKIVHRIANVADIDAYDRVRDGTNAETEHTA